MANPSKAKGTKAESDVAYYAKTHGFPYAERMALAGNLDRGDVRLTQLVVVEVKAYAEVTDGLLLRWFDETSTERRNANADIGLLVVKRPRKPVGAWWCWRRNNHGTWSCTWLHNALLDLRREGYGDVL